MGDRKQIRVYVNVNQWTTLKPDTPENDTDTLKRLLAELEQLRSLVGQLADQDVEQLSTMVATLSDIHSNPLIALGMCLERYRQTEFPPVLQSSGYTSRSTIATPNDFIDNSGEF
ncbi:hypothetical protein D0962_37460 [Leptolyngbyaceae cyanobacterium CCMR0082]|uniref:Uncharacterized protein n=1 Tax=Adonisia turfae CCMR0082 TaxID=2304604 RepID=A0A6M0SKF6_9CYAN|nr:hypothetical protein [Adonisia turfae]NEZ68351.1 hypothetical protein [Adonisia turfae CCMR0082]